MWRLTVEVYDSKHDTPRDPLHIDRNFVGCHAGSVMGERVDVTALHWLLQAPAPKCTRPGPNSLHTIASGAGSHGSYGSVGRCSDRGSLVRRERPRVVLVSIGGYVDTNDIVHDSIGTKSHVPKAIPSYIVRIFEPYPVALGPSKNNHYWKRDCQRTKWTNHWRVHLRLSGNRHGCWLAIDESLRLARFSPFSALLRPQRQ